MIREIHWPYESRDPVECPECRQSGKADATTRCYWTDSELELRCRNPRCQHQWTVKTVDWSLVGKMFVDGERVDGCGARVESDG